MKRIFIDIRFLDDLNRKKEKRACTQYTLNIDFKFIEINKINRFTFTWD